MFNICTIAYEDLSFASSNSISYIICFLIVVSFLFFDIRWDDDGLTGFIFVYCNYAILAITVFYLYFR